MGEPIEFWSADQITNEFGPNGLTTYVHEIGRISDDTQMTLFTAEGLLRAQVRAASKGVCHPPTVVQHAYIRWLDTQGERSESPFFRPDEFDGLLFEVPELRVRRAPGNTCLSALRSGEAGTMERPINNSKGCGTVMRTAPVGLSGVNDPFQTGCEIGALTHGHPSGYLSAGFLSSVIRLLVWEESALPVAVESSLEELSENSESRECLGAIQKAVTLAAEGQPDSSKVASLGQGWIAEEALSIALYCALAAETFAEGVLLAVNHGGDSDSTGAIAGNLLGAIHGYNAIPSDWVLRLELANLIDEVALDLYGASLEDFNAEEMWNRYPGW